MYKVLKFSKCKRSNRELLTVLIDFFFLHMNATCFCIHGRAFRAFNPIVQCIFDCYAPNHAHSFLSPSWMDSERTRPSRLLSRCHLNSQAQTTALWPLTGRKKKELRRHVRPWDDKMFALLLSWPYVGNVTVSTPNVSGCKDVGEVRKCSMERADSRTETRFQSRNDSHVLFSEQRRQRAHGS